ncbi:MAG: NfeD family protein [Deltaproteobacteria bacterium]|nr:NfeD family protein [Deltaproteobacteria bacterium]
MGVVTAPLFWLIMGVMLFFLELAVPGFILFFFGLGALLTSLAVYLFHLSLSWQLALFIIASLVALFSLRNIVQRQFIHPPAEEDLDIPLVTVGDRGVVTSRIDPPAEGRIRYSGTFWRAAAEEEIDEGEIISIVSQEGLIIHVERV